jgi:uncharacterized protein
MARVFWDAMLFIYLLEDDRRYSPRVEELARRMDERGDILCTSSLAVGEILAGWYRAGRSDTERVVDGIRAMQVQILPFTEQAALRFAELRGRNRLPAPDAIHLACAAEAGTDLFLTNDKALLRLHVPGVKFIGSLESNIL